MKITRDIIAHAFANYRPAVAFSGGGDSMVLLDIITAMGCHPPVIYSDSQMEYPETLQFVRKISKDYGLTLHVARASITPPQCWARHGYPMLGKMSARIWMQHHRNANDFGFRLDVSTCCRKMKIEPARQLIKALKCNATLTGQRGAEDDRLRGLREFKEGAIHYLAEDDLTQINPMLGWTDTMVTRYAEAHKLPAHPLKAKGALTIGCLYCGGGAQFDNSGFRVLRRTDPTAWRRMIVDFGFGEIILSIKYDRPLPEIREAIAKLGGIETLADSKSWLFDFLRKTPLKGYTR